MLSKSSIPILLCKKKTISIRVYIPVLNNFKLIKMKKIIGILGVAVIAVAMFINSNNIETTNDFDLASLMSLSSANAEGSGVCSGCMSNYMYSCAGPGTLCVYAMPRN
jgi:hypothetical protein